MQIAHSINVMPVQGPTDSYVCLLKRAVFVAARNVRVKQPQPVRTQFEYPRRIMSVPSIRRSYTIDCEMSPGPIEDRRTLARSAITCSSCDMRLSGQPDLYE